MTTNTYTTPYEHTSDATFRAWVQALHNAMTGAGLTQTADTGQFNFASATRPGINTSAAPLIYQFSDTLQATYPVFIKLTPGTGGGAAIPRLLLQVGTSTNGASTLTGTTSTDVICSGSNTITSTVSNYTTYVCVLPGHVGVCWKNASTLSATIAQAFFAVSRSVDSAGANNGDGVTIYRGSTSFVYVQPLSFTTGVGNNNNGYCLIGNGVTSSFVGSDTQVYKHYSAYPRMRPNPYMLTLITAEYPLNTLFSATPVGSLSHDYISLPGIVAVSAGSYGANTTTAHCIAMVWE